MLRTCQSCGKRFESRAQRKNCPTCWEKRVRAPLQCAHCGSTFHGSVNQRTSARLGKRVYCSSFCRVTRVSEEKRKPLPFQGTCATCGSPFGSREPNKKFCSHACYLASDLFRQMHARRAERSSDAQREAEIQCPQCGETFFPGFKRKKRFCSRVCYRAYFAERYDRWVASPERIALPQNYDEFLSQEELPCLIEDCEWIGRNLSMHMNQAHGVRADEFKKAAGFNLTTGVVSAPAARALRARAKVGVALMPDPTSMLPPAGHPGTYQSLEGKEHRLKARAERSAEVKANALRNLQKARAARWPAKKDEPRG
jgi:hypothetical protein